MQATLQRSGSAWYRQRVLSFSLYGISGSVVQVFVSCINVVYLPIYAKLGLVVSMTKQMSDGKEVDIVNC